MGLSKNTYSDDDLDFEDDDYSDFDSGISGFEIAYGSSNKTVIKNRAKKQHKVKHKLELIREKKRFDRETNTLSDFWEDHSY